MMNRLSLQGTDKVVFAALAACALVMGACTTDKQIGGEGGSGGESAGTQGTTTGGNTTTGENTATGGNITTGGNGGAGGGSDLDLINVALLNSEITQVTDADKSKWLDAGEMLDPTTLIVVVSDQLQSCNNPVVFPGQGPQSTTHHEVLVGLPQSMQKVGKYDLSSTDVIAFGSSWLSDGMGNGGGVDTVLTTGTVEILDFSADAIQIRIEGLSGDFVLQNGERWVVHCP